MFFDMIMFFVMTFIAVTMNSFMDTFAHHANYKTTFWRRYGWHKAKSGWRAFMYGFIIGLYKASLPILKGSNDAWHWAKRAMILSLVLVGVYASKVVEAGVASASDYFAMIGIIFTAVWCFGFWQIYDKWMIHRKRIEGRWYEYAYMEDGAKYYFDFASEEDPYGE